MSLRPEKIIVGPNAKKMKNNFICSIKELIFQGTITRIQAELKNGRSIVIKAVGAVENKVGDSITIGWNEEDSNLILE